VKDKRCDQRNIPRRERVALVRKHFIVERRDRKTVLLDAGEDGSEKKLNDGESEVGFERKLGRVRALPVRLSSKMGGAGNQWTDLVDVRAHAVEEGPDVIDRRRVDEFALVKPQTDPQVV
jgi:hypothetical protein